MTKEEKLTIKSLKRMSLAIYGRDKTGFQPNENIDNQLKRDYALAQALHSLEQLKGSDK